VGIGNLELEKDGEWELGIWNWLVGDLFIGNLEFGIWNLELEKNSEWEFGIGILESSSLGII